MDIPALRKAIDTSVGRIHPRAPAGVRAHPEQVARLRSATGKRTATWMRRWSSWRTGAARSRSRTCGSRCAGCPGRTPLLLVDIPGELPDCVLLYGHLDKQPEFTGWLPGLGPWEPVIRDGKLYGRGGADDGYACFSSIAAIAALKAQGVPLARCVVLIEASEESGSVASACASGGARATHRHAFARRVPRRRMRQLRSAVVHDLAARQSRRSTARARADGRRAFGHGHRHRADAVPHRCSSCSRGSRIRSTATSFSRSCRSRSPRIAVRRSPRRRTCWARKSPASCLSPKACSPVSNDPVELMINSTWRATLAVTGADGLPSVLAGGNVLLPELTLKLSLRLPPTVRAARAANAVKAALERDPPYGAQVTFDADSATSGWNAPAVAPWLEQSMAACLAGRFRPRGGVHRRGRHDSVHGHAGRALSADAVLHHRGARPAGERARAERVPAHRLRAKAHGVRRTGAGRTTPRRAR